MLTAGFSRLRAPWRTSAVAATSALCTSPRRYSIGVWTKSIGEGKSQIANCLDDFYTHKVLWRMCIYFLFLPPASKQAAHRALQIGDLQLTRFAVSPFSQKGTLRYHLFGNPALNSLTQNKIYTPVPGMGIPGKTTQTYPERSRTVPYSNYSRCSLDITR